MTVTAQILDGKAAAAIKAELRDRVSVLRDQGIVPGLGTILVGSDPGSLWYVAGWISPNPGGVGPMTRAMLLANVVETAERPAP